MTTHHHCFPWSASGLLALVLIVGCRNEAAVIPAKTAVPVPDQFQNDGQTWEKQSALQDADTDCLTTFFGQHRDLVGSPELEGTPVLFTSGRSDRRFYWLRPTADGTRWRCVHFESGKFAITDGKDSPFD